VVSIPDLIPLDHEASMSGLMRRSVYGGIIDRSIEQAQRILTLSSISRDSLVERGADPLKIRIVPPAVDMRFTPLTLEEIKGARERFAEGRSYVAAAMRDKPHKNYPGLLAAAKALSHMDVKFVMTGMPARDREVAGVGPLNDRELRAFYGGAEAVVVPSYIEGFGLPVGEALACGVPVVCGNRVGALDLLAEGTIAVDPSDHGEFAEAVVSLIRDPHRRKQLVDGGRPKALALTEHALAEATASVYSEVVG
jgi:alpha-1,3-rhamnosyl/mannosyltransferase